MMRFNEISIRQLLFATAWLAVFNTVPAYGVGFANENLDSAGQERSVVKFRDDFDSFNSSEWRAVEYSEGISAKGGILILSTPGTPAKCIRLTSHREFLYATLKARLRFSAVGKPTNHYIGFITRDCWDDASNRQSVWLMDSCVKRFEMWWGKGEELGGTLLSPDIQADRWYEIEIRWSPKQVEFLLDGKVIGSSAKAVPDVPMPVVMDMFSFENIPFTMEVDFIEVEGTEVVKPADAEEPAAVLPPVRAKVWPEPPKNTAPSISEHGNSVRLANRFFTYDLDLKSNEGPMIRSYRNRYLPETQQEMLDAPSRLLVLHRGVENCRNEDFRVIAKRIDGNTLFVTLENREVPGLLLHLRMTVADSPELACRMELENKGTEKTIHSVSFPMLEHLKIGDKVSDDAIFYPSETGFCGMVDFDLRGIYGYSLWMPLMAVFDPVVGGGVYVLPELRDGVPAILMVRRNSRPGKLPPLYNEIWWETQSPKNFFTNRVGSSMVFKPLEFELAPGAKAHTPEVMLGVSTGDWRQPLEAYTRFVRSWFKNHAETPQWYRDSFVFGSGHDTGGLHMMSYKNKLGVMDGGYWDPQTNQYRYSKLMRAGEENYVIEFAFWNPYGCDPAKKWDNPGKIAEIMKPGDWDFNAARGGVKALREEIAAIHRNHGRLMLYFYQEVVHKSTETFRKYGMKYAAMSRPGVFAPRYGSPDSVVNYCMLEEGVREYFSQLLADRIGASGADGARLDVLSYQFPCFNPAHKHYDGTFRGSFSPDDVNALIRLCRQRVRVVNPEGVITTEHAGNDYLLTESSGFFAQTKCWFDIPEFKRFRPFNQYRLDFLRFVIPEVNGPMSGLPVDIAEATAIFNGNGAVCCEPEVARVLANLRENGDVLHSGMLPKPYIDTLQEQLYCNFFPGHAKNAWSFYNRSGHDFNAVAMLEIPAAPDRHYVEVIGDMEVAVRNGQNGKSIMSFPLANEKAAMVVELPRLLSAAVDGNRLKVKVNGPASKTMKLKMIRLGHDVPGMGEELPLDGSDAEFRLLPGDGPVIVKLLDGYYLADEIIVPR